MDDDVLLPQARVVAMVIRRACGRPRTADLRAARGLLLTATKVIGWQEALEDCANGAELLDGMVVALELGGLIDATAAACIRPCVEELRASTGEPAAEYVPNPVVWSQVTQHCVYFLIHAKRWHPVLWEAATYGLNDIGNGESGQRLLNLVSASTRTPPQRTRGQGT